MNSLFKDVRLKIESTSAEHVKYVYHAYTKKAHVQKMYLDAFI